MVPLFSSQSEQDVTHLARYKCVISCVIETIPCSLLVANSIAYELLTSLQQSKISLGTFLSRYCPDNACVTLPRAWKHGVA